MTIDPTRAGFGSRARWHAAPEGAATAALLGGGVPKLLAPLLARRGVDSVAAAEAFLAPSVAALHDPLELPGMSAATDRLLAARRRRIAIVGDYDVDGVASAALLDVACRRLGIEPTVILPDRHREGYGFQPVHVAAAAAAGCGLIVTADCGSSSRAAAEAALAAGIEVVVTDHHRPTETLPGAVVEINPQRHAGSYPFRELSGAGLAFKLVQAVTVAAGDPFPVDSLLRVACLGTIADVVPLRGENRVIAALGLRALGTPRSCGLRALLRCARVSAPLRAVDVAMRLGPRLNAAGRLASAGPAFELLVTRDPQRAEELAARLDGWNRERQQHEAVVLEEARSMVLARTPLPPIVVAWKPSWHRGVVGIAAGRLSRELTRPAILLTVEGERAVGSGRSVPGIDLHAFLAPSAGELERFGGHSQAVGLAVDRERLESLRRRWEEAAAQLWDAERLTPRYEYELVLGCAGISEATLRRLSELEPFGAGNPQPIVRVGPVHLAGEVRSFGRGHLAAAIRDAEGDRAAVVGWRWEARRGDLAGQIELLGTLEPDRYHGVALRLVDARPAA